MAADRPDEVADAPKDGLRIASRLDPLALFVSQVPGQSEPSASRHAAVRPWSSTVTAPRHPAFPLLDDLLTLASGTQPSLWGLLPADLEARTGLSPDDLAQAIEHAVGYDLYFVSAHPGLEGVHHNPWRSVEASQPGFCAVTTRLLAAAGVPTMVVDAVTPSTLFATGHLMVATPAFWKSYLHFLTRVLDRGLAGVSHALGDLLSKPADGPGRMTVLGLIAARLLGVFLMADVPERWRVCKFSLPQQEAALNEHLRVLRDLKDAGLASASNAVLEGWLGYRLLYLMQAQGADWVRERLPRITPSGLLRASSVHPIDLVRPAAVRPAAATVS